MSHPSKVPWFIYKASQWGRWRVGLLLLSEWGLGIRKKEVRGYWRRGWKSNSSGKLNRISMSSTPGLPVHHQLLEFTQIYVHWVGDAIQPSHPLSSPSPPASNPSQHQCLFQWVNASHEVAKSLEFQLQFRYHQKLFQKQKRRIFFFSYLDRNRTSFFIFAFTAKTVCFYVRPPHRHGIHNMKAITEKNKDKILSKPSWIFYSHWSNLSWNPE